MLRRKRTVGLIVGCPLIAMLLVSGCVTSKPVSKKTPVVRTAAYAPAPTISAIRVYVRNLALAHLTYQLEADSLAAKPYLDKMDESAAKQPSATPKSTTLYAVIFEYRIHGKSKERSQLVPVTRLDAHHYEFSGLKQATALLAAHEVEYTHFHTRTVTLDEPLAMPVGTTPDDYRAKVEELYSTIVDSQQKIPAIDRAHLQLALSLFFMERGIRDAAYVTLENSKLRLAEVDTGQPESAAQVDALVKETAAYETELHQRLPYRF